MNGESQPQLILHASAVALGNEGLLILGKSGSGKSTLALQLIALGAELVSDDRVSLSRDDARIDLAAPEPLAGMIEARGLGLLKTSCSPARLKAAVDLDIVEQNRFPAPLTKVFLGIEVPCFGKIESPAFAAMLLVYLKGDRAAP